MNCKDLDRLYEIALSKEKEAEKKVKFEKRLNSFRLHYYQKLIKIQSYNLIKKPVGFFENKCPYCNAKLGNIKALLSYWAFGNNYLTNNFCKPCKYYYIKRIEIRDSWFWVF